MLLWWVWDWEILSFLEYGISLIVSKTFFVHVFQGFRERINFLRRYRYKTELWRGVESTHVVVNYARSQKNSLNQYKTSQTVGQHCPCSFRFHLGCQWHHWKSFAWCQRGSFPWYAWDCLLLLLLHVVSSDYSILQEIETINYLWWCQQSGWHRETCLNFSIPWVVR